MHGVLLQANTTHFTDGLHLTPVGYEQYFTCLKPQVAGLVKRSQAARALAAAALTQGP